MLYNAGVGRPLTVVAPAGTIVNAVRPAAVAGGNTETSQRITDVVLGALGKAWPDRLPAASQGTMNNITLGGTHPATGARFAYYETMAGGMGARQGLDGLSGVHTHMSNTRNTPVEAIEHYLPVRITTYALRAGSGGAGRWRGGDGIVRELLAVPGQRMPVGALLARIEGPDDAVALAAGLALWLGINGTRLGKIVRALDQIAAHPPSLSPITVGAIGVACALGYLDFRFQGEWRKAHPKLAKWQDGFAARVPAYNKTQPSG